MRQELVTFTGGEFRDGFRVTDGAAKVWNELEHDWINVPLGHHIVCGTQNEFHPIAPELLDPNNPNRTYDLTDGSDPVT